jgi:uncharacterized metal-binding protein
MFNCALCNKHTCSTGEIDKAPTSCPSLRSDTQIIKAFYKDDDVYHLAHHSTDITGKGYLKNTRLEEIIEFAKACGYKKLGIAFCLGLSNETKILHKILVHHGFEVESVICKNGNIPKKFIDINSDVTMCNPIGQAMLLNLAQTDFNIMFGLCVGHDSLFTKYSKVYTTTLAVKDRILAHNPIGAIYQADAYYEDKLFAKKESQN